MSYRKEYEEYTGMPIPSGWDIHHIDLDRGNNCIENLVALPKLIHKKLHKAIWELPEKINVVGFQNALFPFEWKHLESHYQTFLEVSVCTDFRNYLTLKNTGKVICGGGYIPLLEEWDYTTLIKRLESPEAHIIKSSNVKRWKTDVPNTVITGKKSKEISYYSKWLYVYILSVARDNGKCWQSTKVLSNGSGLSTGQVSKSKKELEKVGLIELYKSDHYKGDFDTIIIKDI